MMTRREWRGGSDWEEVEPLGRGGQSEVFLVRNSERIAQRKKHLEKLKELAGQGFNDERAYQFAEAMMGYGREDKTCELGALKIYNPRAAGPDAEKQALERLRIEITVLGQNRPGLPRLLDSNEGARWIVTQYLPGGTLEDRVLTYKGNPLLCLTDFQPLVETVAALHKENVFHRDIKPANVFTGNKGNLILGDFGIAFLPDRPERLTFLNESVGPRHYMPPWAETEERLEDVGGNFDVYMLGKLLWCMAAGRLRLIREWHRRPEFDLTAKFPNDPHMHAINAILDKCLQDDPKKCLPVAGELLMVVNEHLSVMRRGGQMLSEGVPRPCRICGKGFYQPSGSTQGSSAQTLALPLSESVPGGGSASWRQEGPAFVQFLVCDYCRNVELFKAT
jgi:serine/threonine protein kinase